VKQQGFVGESNVGVFEEHKGIGMKLQRKLGTRTVGLGRMRQ
jgi:hypothetical protein